MSIQTKEYLDQDYGKYLFVGEAIETGYPLIRDAIVFTNERILFVDKQSTTGKKTSFNQFIL